MVKSLKLLSGEPTSRTFQEFWLSRMREEIGPTVGQANLLDLPRRKKSINLSLNQKPQKA